MASCERSLRCAAANDEEETPMADFADRALIPGFADLFPV